VEFWIRTSTIKPAIGMNIAKIGVCPEKSGPYDHSGRAIRVKAGVEAGRMSFDASWMAYGVTYIMNASR